MISINLIHGPSPVLVWIGISFEVRIDIFLKSPKTRFICVGGRIFLFWNNIFHVVCWLWVVNVNIFGVAWQFHHVYVSSSPSPSPSLFFLLNGNWTHGIMSQGWMRRHRWRARYEDYRSSADAKMTYGGAFNSTIGGSFIWSHSKISLRLA